ncbi:cobalamin-binding protein [Algibacter marinivivus]|uniref:Cobalamin-binding protein n=1 Tax=Algibacter marinivivus TaxID=2100723 RepID=A0A2U2X5P9_9FLAO|nr:helical backbone metal receptor [Algibacter marinivivus]PWH83074.1 cobalamin-binding protein [Algibacter marinivivus]
MQDFKDQLNRIIHLKETPKRIISLVPSQTELLCDLGLEPYLVGVTKFCVHPHHVKTKTTVIGGTKQIHLDKIKALNPDIILCNKEENTKDIVESCEHVCSVHVSDIYNIDDSLELISQYGEIFNCMQNAFSIIKKIETELRSFNLFIKNKPSLKVAYFIWKNPWMVVGNHTFIDYLLDLNKLQNVYSNKERYPEIELTDSAVHNNVDVVMLSSEPFPFKETHKKELQELYPNATIILVDGEMFSWYGSRLTKAFAYFKTLRLNLQNNAL